MVVRFVYKCGIQRSAYNEKKEKANKTKHTRMIVNPTHIAAIALIRTWEKQYSTPSIAMFALIHFNSQSVSPCPFSADPFRYKYVAYYATALAIKIRRFSRAPSQVRVCVGPIPRGPLPGTLSLQNG